MSMPIGRSSSTTPTVHRVLAKVLLFRRTYEQGALYLDRALALCPNDAELLMQAALCEVYLGRPEAGVAHVARATRLNPCHPNWYCAVSAVVHLFACDMATALAFRQKSDVLPFVDAAAYCAVAHAHAGEIAAGRKELERFHAEYLSKITFGAPFEPGAPLRWLLEVGPYRRPEDVAFVREGVRLLDNAREPETRASPVTPTAASLARTGDGWIVEFDGRSAVLPDLKGLRDVARLLERPDGEPLRLRPGQRFGDDCRPQIDAVNCGGAVLRHEQAIVAANTASAIETLATGKVDPP